MKNTFAQTDFGLTINSAAIRPGPDTVEDENHTSLGGCPLTGSRNNVDNGEDGRRAEQQLLELTAQPEKMKWRHRRAPPQDTRFAHLHRKKFE